MSNLATVFPPPPFYYEAFTEANWERAQNLDGEEPGEDLEYLVPPPPPETPTYRGFGSIWNTEEKLVPLKEAGVEQLYEDLGANNENLVPELKKLLKSVLVNFVTLIGIMSTDPEQFPAKVDDLRVLFINIHHLLNLYRPHQSRESLVLLMTEQIAARRREIAEMKASNSEIEQRIKTLVEHLPNLTQMEPTEKPESEWDQFDLEVDKLP